MTGIKIHILIFMMLFSLKIKAQDGIVLFLENWVNNQNTPDIEIALENLVVNYQNIYFDETDIYSFQKWKQFYFLSERELELIFSFLRTNKNEKDVKFLNRIEGISTETAYFIRYKFLESNGQSEHKIKEKREFISYVLIPDLDKKGYIKNRNKLNFSNDRIRFSFQTEQDAGESNITDFLSSGMKIKSKATDIFIGDYIAQFGLGLSLFQGFQFPSMALLLNTKNGFRLHTGAHENKYMRGLAISQAVNRKYNLYGFLSRKKSDGRLTNDFIT